MTDFHIHIGQFRSAYFYSDRVFSALKKNVIDGCWFSSTTSCIYCKESEAAKQNPEIMANAPTAQVLYENVRDEVKNALDAAYEIGIESHALYWVVPEILFSGISIESAMREVSYDGFKIHPRAQKWNFMDDKIRDLTDGIFLYSEKQGKRILIHTGVEEIDSPRKFEDFILSHKDAEVQLAHCKDIDGIRYMLKKYPNVVADTSCTENDKAAELLKEFGEKRILFGTDFPALENFSSDPTEMELNDRYSVILELLNKK